MDIKSDAARSMMMCRSLPIFIEVPSLDPIQAIIPTVGTVCSGCYQQHTGLDGQHGTPARKTHLSMLRQAVPCSHPPDWLWRRARKTLRSAVARSVSTCGRTCT